MSGIVSGKVVVVTGAGGGIGRGIALAMAWAGAKVVVNDIGVSLTGEGGGEGPAQAVVREIAAAGGQAVASTDSVAAYDSASRIIQAAIDAFGRIDAVVNNAGNLRDRVFHKMSEEEGRQVIDVHLNGSFFMSRAAAPYFREQESGAFVHMTSTSGLIGNFGQANYAAAKLGIVALSKSIALDMARYNMRSNCIAPFAWSRMISSIPAETEEERARVEKLKKMEAGKVHRSGVRGARQRDHADEPAAAAAQRALQRRLDARADRRDRRARHAQAVLRVGAFVRRDRLGPAGARRTAADGARAAAHVRHRHRQKPHHPRDRQGRGQGLHRGHRTHAA